VNGPDPALPLAEQLLEALGEEPSLAPEFLDTLPGLLRRLGRRRPQEEDEDVEFDYDAEGDAEARAECRPEN
jgi:hypothetical protein